MESKICFFLQHLNRNYEVCLLQSKWQRAYSKHDCVRMTNGRLMTRWWCKGQQASTVYPQLKLLLKVLREFPFLLVPILIVYMLTLSCKGLTFCLGLEDISFSLRVSRARKTPQSANTTNTSTTGSTTTNNKKNKNNKNKRRRCCHCHFLVYQSCKV